MTSKIFLSLFVRLILISPSLAFSESFCKVEQFRDDKLIESSENVLFSAPNSHRSFHNGKVDFKYFLGMDWKRADGSDLSQPGFEFSLNVAPKTGADKTTTAMLISVTDWIPSSVKYKSAAECKSVHSDLENIGFKVLDRCLTSDEISRGNESKYLSYLRPRSHVDKRVFLRPDLPLPHVVSFRMRSEEPNSLFDAALGTPGRYFEITCSFGKDLLY